MGVHSTVCMFEFLACLAGFIGGLARPNWWPPLWYTSLVLLFTFPIINEILLTLKGYCFKFRILRAPEAFPEDVFPIVYSPKYNIHAFGLEKLHPFDASKYRRVFEDLVTSGHIGKRRLHRPSVPSREFLQFVMAKWYLFKLNYTYFVCKAVELPLPLPGWMLRMRLLDPMACASKGSVEAACLAR